MLSSKELSLVAQAPAPFLKWAGGKRSLLPAIKAKFRSFTGRYVEPFVGAGAVLFSMGDHVKKIANDFNSELINVYQAIEQSPEALIDELSLHRNDKEYFLKLRAIDREAGFKDIDPMLRASRFIYLNKTCFNGLYRVNSAGQFNVPFGDQKNPELVSANNLRLVSAFIRGGADGHGGVSLFSGSYEGVTSGVEANDLVYLDPPYDPLSRTASFVSYSDAGFGKEDQEKLASEARRLIELGAQVVLSNSDTPFIRSLYRNTDCFQIAEIDVRRRIGASVASRIATPELIITSCPQS
jgi:DNA adenine methylase